MELNKLKDATAAIKLDIPLFYKVIGKLDQNNKNVPNPFSYSAYEGDYLAKVRQVKADVSDIRLKAAKINSEILSDAQVATKTNPFKPLDQQERDAADFLPSFDGVTFIYCIYKSFYMFEQCYEGLLNLEGSLQEPFVHISNKEFKLPKNLEEMQLQKLEFDSNHSKIERYLETLLNLATIQEQVGGFLSGLEKHFEHYYSFLNKKHVIDGEEIYSNAIATDIAVTIINNIDAHGELQVVKDPSKISAFTASKALNMANFVKNNRIVQESIKNPEYFTQCIVDNLVLIRETVNNIKDKNHAKILLITDIMADLRVKVSDIFYDKFNFDSLITSVKNLNPAYIVRGKESKILSKEERFSRAFLNETVEEVVKRLQSPDCRPLELKDYILQRKSSFVVKAEVENCFYTCRIGAGNPFVGIAPGAIEIVSSPKPNVKLENIKGSGFQEVREFIQAIENNNAFRDLFIATSPSRSTDKANCLLIGPPGSGKSELMRALANQKGFSVIAAQGSDFLTCWKGEDLKNPKRLFEAAYKIHKQTGHHIHICIDEIDAVLNNSQSHGETNLTREFQILMDGMVDYPGISVWGATNYPERIPDPMIRRFPKVLIVGELSKQDRRALLEIYSSSLPYKDMNDAVWNEAADKLEGATGDVIRKICDMMWRDKISNFVNNNKEKAREIVEMLNKEKQFEIDNFDDKERFNFQKKLSKHVYIDPNYLLGTINAAVKQLAIYSEITTAKDTYAKAKKFLTDIEKGSRADSNIILLRN